MTPKIAAILDDPATSVWLNLALLSALNRDPVDAAANAEGLKDTLKFFNYCRKGGNDEMG